MVIVVLPMVPGNNYFILEGEYSGEMTPSKDAGSGPVCLTSVERNSDGRLLSLSRLPASHFSQNVRITRRGTPKNLVEQAKQKQEG
jgi:hypothetical protein